MRSRRASERRGAGFKLASAAGHLSLTEDVVALGGELQLTRLKQARDSKDASLARACYVEQNRPGDSAYQSVDRMVARSGGLAAAQTGGAGQMDDVD